MQGKAAVTEQPVVKGFLELSLVPNAGIIFNKAAGTILKQSCRHTNNENLVNHLLLTHRNVECRISISFLTMWIIYRQV